MADAKIEVVLYHSVVCPRCHLSKLALAKILPEFPGVELSKVEFLTNSGRAREDGVRSIPTLVARGKSLSGVVLTPSRIRRFIESLDLEAV